MELVPSFDSQHFFIERETVSSKLESFNLQTRQEKAMDRRGGATNILGPNI